MTNIVANISLLFSPQHVRYTKYVNIKLNFNTKTGPVNPSIGLYIQWLSQRQICNMYNKFIKWLYLGKQPKYVNYVSKSSLSICQSKLIREHNAFTLKKSALFAASLLHFNALKCVIIHLRALCSFVFSLDDMSNIHCSSFASLTMMYCSYGISESIFSAFAKIIFNSLNFPQGFELVCWGNPTSSQRVLCSMCFARRLEKKDGSESRSAGLHLMTMHSARWRRSWKFWKLTMIWFDNLSIWK